MILISVKVTQYEKFVTDGRRLWFVIHGYTSRNLWSLECRQRLGMLTNFSVFLLTLGSGRMKLV